MKDNTVHFCRSCGHSKLDVFLDLGSTPLADRLLSSEQLKEKEPYYPLELAFCPSCSLVQILQTIPPEELFCDRYPYYSSFIPALLKHSRENVINILNRRKLTNDSMVVELASNDGYLLKNYVEFGIPILGIDPAEGPAKAAEKIGIPTLRTFFTKDLARNLAQKGQKADIVHANNVLAHVADTNGFVEGLNILLKTDGLAIIEVPYVLDLITHCEFDTIYHEHLCYFSVMALDYLFRSHSLYINDIEKLAIHGGSLRIYVEKFEKVNISVKLLLAEERKLMMEKTIFYKNFSKQVTKLKKDLNMLLSTLKMKGYSIVAYGAAAKGSTLINYVDIDKNYIDFVVDRNTYKQGLYMPGKHWQICKTEKLLECQPDYVLLLAWNFAEEIFDQQKEYRARGGQFIVPVPSPRIM